MEFALLLARPEGLEKTAGLAAWIQDLFGEGEKPVLVGGAAVELYTGGAYTTGDLDFVGTPTPSVRARLTEAGFARHGRHWIHDIGQVFVEFHGAHLAEGEHAARLAVGDIEILIVSPEDLLAERLGAWQHWQSAVDGVNAFLLHSAQRSALSRKRLQQRVVALQAEQALAALDQFVSSRRRGRVNMEDVERWAVKGP